MIFSKRWHTPFLPT